MDDEPEHFWEHVRINLSVGRLRLVFAADAIPADLRRIVEFMNEQMSRPRCSHSRSGNTVRTGRRRQTLVSRVFGWTAAAQRRKDPGSAQAAWTREDFRRMLPKPQFEVASARPGSSRRPSRIRARLEVGLAPVGGRLPGRSRLQRCLIELAAEAPVKLAINWRPSAARPARARGAGGPRFTSRRQGDVREGLPESASRGGDDRLTHATSEGASMAPRWPLELDSSEKRSSVFGPSLTRCGAIASRRLRCSLFSADRRTPV